MLQSISWGQLIIFLLIAMTIYYIAILLIYYRKGIFNFPGCLFSRADAVEPKPTPYNNNSNALIISTIHELVEELKTLFTYLSKINCVKEELIQALQIKLRDYQQIKGTALQSAVNRY
jgi:hypothetical protein